MAGRRKSDQDRANENLRIISDQNEQLDLIRVNVDNVKKNVNDISIYTQKQIQAIDKALDREIKKFEELQKKIKDASGNVNKETENNLKNMINNVNRLSQEIINLGNTERRENKKTHDEKMELQEEEKAYRQKIYDTEMEHYNKEAEYQRKISGNRSSAISNLASGNIGGAISDIGSIRQTKNLRVAEDALKNAKEAFLEGKLDETGMRNAIKSYSDSIDKIDASASKFSAASTAANIAVTGIKKLVSLWTDRFFNGMQRIIDKYEDTFQKQAVMTGVSQREYQAWQNQAVSNLTKQGLQNNIAITDVMDMTSQFVSNGISNFAKASEMGQQAAIRNVLAPYLDATSEAMTSLELQMPGISNSLAGIGSYVSDTVGQNRFTVKNLQNLIDLTEPVSLAAKKDLLGAEGLAMIEDLVAGGMDMQSATKMATDIASAVADPLSALEGNNVALASAIAAGERDFTGIARYSMGTQASIMAGTDGDLGSAAALQAAGLWGTYNYNSTGEFGRVLSNLESGIYKNGPTSEVVDTAENYEKLMKKLANDELQTVKQIKDILGENISTGLATIAERFPDTWEVMRGICSAIINALLMWAGSKLFNSITGGKGFSGLFGKSAGKHAATAAGSKGASSLGAVALPAAGAAAGAGLGIYNGVQAYNDFKAGNTGYGIADTVGAVAGGTAAVTLGATAASAAGVGGAVGAFGAMAAVPVVGWVALGVSAIVAAGVAINKYTESVKKSTDATEEINALNEAQAKEMRTSHNEQMKDLNLLNARVKATSDVETAKKLIIDAGIATEKDLQGEQYNSIRALQDLTDQYVKTKNAMNQNAEKFLQDINSSTGSQKQGFINDYLQKLGVDKDYKDLTDKDKKAINELGLVTQQYVRDLQNQGVDLNQDQYKHLKYMVDKGLMDKNYNDDNVTEGDYRILFREGTNADRRTVLKNMLAQDTYYNQLMANGEYSNDILGNKYGFNPLVGNGSEIATALSNLIDAAGSNKKSDVEKYVSQAKSAGLNSLDQLNAENKSKVESALKKVGIDQYKGGTSYVSADGLAFLAHEGEAVLTQPAAALLRASTNSDISTVQGVSDALSTSSSLTREGFNLVVSAISDQTTQLVAKMDQVLSAINSNKVGSTYNNKLVNLRGGLTPNAE